MDKKRSFFGRLVHTKDVAKEEEEETTTPAPPPVEEPKAKIEIPVKEDKPELPQEPQAKTNEESEEWASDYEGQLTIDVYQTPAEIVIKSTIAGVKPENIDVSIDNDMVTIKGERTNDDEVAEEDYYYQECYWGAFSRSVILPVEVKADEADAQLRNGILTLRLPKANQQKTKRISVRAV